MLKMGNSMEQGLEIYVDGSRDNGKVGSGIAVFSNDTILYTESITLTPMFKRWANVGAECMAFLFGIEYFTWYVQHYGVCNATIYYDFCGGAEYLLPNSTFKVRKVFPRVYVAKAYWLLHQIGFINATVNALNTPFKGFWGVHNNKPWFLIFEKLEGHSGNDKHDLADQLAKCATKEERHGC